MRLKRRFCKCWLFCSLEAKPPPGNCWEKLRFVDLQAQSTNLNFWVRIFSGGVGVFHVKGWGPKSSVCLSKPGKSNFFGGTSRDFARISWRSPKSLRKKSFCSTFGPIDLCCFLCYAPFCGMSPDFAPALAITSEICRGISHWNSLKVRLQGYGYDPFCSHSFGWLAVLVWQYFEEAFCAPKVRLKWYGFKGFPSQSSHCSGGLFPQYSRGGPIS